MTCAILTGGIDLSVGPVMALAGSVAAGLMLAAVPIPLAMVAALAVGALFGPANGACIAYLRMPPIIVTRRRWASPAARRCSIPAATRSPACPTSSPSSAVARCWASGADPDHARRVRAGG